MKKKFLKISDFESVGVKLPEDRGGGFIPLTREVPYHSLAFEQIHEYIKEFAKNKNGNPSKQWQAENQIQKLILSEKDMAAYKNWCKIPEKKRPRDLSTFSDFAVNYLNSAKIGTYTGMNKNGGILTADFTPHITYEKWLRDGFHIVSTKGKHDFDEKSKKFVYTEPTLYHVRVDEMKRLSLQEDLYQKKHDFEL